MELIIDADADEVGIGKFDGDRNRRGVEGGVCRSRTGIQPAQSILGEGPFDVGAASPTGLGRCLPSVPVDVCCNVAEGAAARGVEQDAIGSDAAAHADCGQPAIVRSSA